MVFMALRCEGGQDGTETNGAWAGWYDTTTGTVKSKTVLQVPMGECRRDAGRCRSSLLQRPRREYAARCTRWKNAFRERSRHMRVWER